MVDFNIEKLKEEHIKDVITIDTLSYGVHHWSDDAFLSEIKNPVSNYLAAITPNGKPLGYIGVWRVIDEAHITTLAVHPDYRGQNIATRLLLKQIEMCMEHEIKYLTLEVRPTNIGAIKLYEKFGFNSLGVRKKYYQDNGEDALIMWTKNILDKEYQDLYEKIKKEVEREKIG